jgi:hypothetical protein
MFRVRDLPLDELLGAIDEAIGIRDHRRAHLIGNRRHTLAGHRPSRAHAAVLGELRIVVYKLAVWLLKLNHNQVVIGAVRRIAECLYRCRPLPCVYLVRIPLIPLTGHNYATTFRWA